MVRIVLALAAILTAFAAAQSSQSPKPEREVRFEILSIRPIQPGAALSAKTDPSPNGFTARLSMWQIIMLGFTMDDAVTFGATELRNAPNWLGNFYDIDARVSEGDIKGWQHQSSAHEMLRSALRTALRDRCKLAIHNEPGQAEMLELIVAKGGPRLKPSAPGSTPPPGGKLPSGGVAVGEQVHGRTVWHYYSATMGDLVQFLKIISNRRSVQDRTGLTGRYDFTFQQISEPLRGDDAIYNFPIDHLGLKLRLGKENRPILVIDHIEKPSAN